MLANLVRAAAAAACAVLVCAPRAAPQVDHVVVVLLDDVGIDKVAAYDAHPTAGPTPLLDALAADGVLFTRAYADPVCAASRAAALTGLYGSRTGVGAKELAGAGDPPDPATFAPSDDLPWLPRRLAAGGVRSGAVGKWHLTHKGVPDYERHAVSVGFERYAGPLFNLGALGGSYTHWNKTVADASAAATVTSTTYATADAATEGLAFLLDTADERSFLWLALSATHKPWHVPPPGTYAGPPPYEPVGQQRAMLQSVEHSLGMLMDAYRAAAPRAAARTLWLVMGDNGTQHEAVEPPWDPEHAKGTVYEAGTRVPLIAWGAGVHRPGARSDALVHVVDLWATVQDALGVAPPTGARPDALLGEATDSVSFLPALAEPAGFAGRGWSYQRVAYPCGFGPYLRRDHAATDGRWKLLERLDGTRELYDLAADPLETVDLWPPVTPEAARAVTRLAAVLAACDTP